MHQLRLRSLALTAAVTAALAAAPSARANSLSSPPTPPQARPALAALGQRLFNDPALSEPRGTSCASCHEERHAFSGTHGSNLGVARGSRAGHFARRNTPSLFYLAYVPAFHYYKEEDDPFPNAFGGFFWDGRADHIAALVLQPLLNPDEMNNRDTRQLAAKLRTGGYTLALEHELGQPLAEPAAAVAALGQALEAFLTSPAMAPFSSKYDAFVQGKAVLTPLEAQGLKLFKNPDKGNCASCHKLTDSSSNPARSLFTDYGYDVVAAPRNPKLRRPNGSDLGLCERTDEQTPSKDDKWCGGFRTPSLRNVAVRSSYMHNGTFTSLRDVVAFYATRATDPMRWYKSKVKFDDLPEKFRGQVNVNSIPYNRRPGEKPPLDDGEIDAIVAFLGTLTDAGMSR